MYKDDKIPQLVDPLLNKDFCEVEAIRFLKVGLLCVQEELMQTPASNVDSHKDDEWWDQHRQRTRIAARAHHRYDGCEN